MPTLLHPDDPAFHRMVAAFEGDPEPWLAVNRALRDTLVSYARRHSPYYGSMIPSGMQFEDVPILSRRLVRERYDELLTGMHRDRWAPWRTSGSSGEPVAFVRDTAQGALENLSAKRFLKWMHRVPPEATTVWIAARPVGKAGRDGRRGIFRRRPDPEIHAVTIHKLTPERLEREARIWSGFKSYFLYGHASGIAWVAGRVQEGLSVRPPLSVVTTSDTLTEHAAGRIATTFGVPVHSWYGSNEMNGYVAGTLPGTRRYAFNPFLVHMEVLDREGNPTPPGGTGRLVLTDLNNLVMPFIRYDTGDLAVASAESVGGFPLIEELVGRDSEVLTLPSGKVLSGATVGSALFVERDFVDDLAFYQCAMTGENALELRVVWARPPTPEGERAVAEAVHSAADPDTDVRVRAVDRLGVLPSGKAWIIRDETRQRGEPDRGLPPGCP
jgi:phenylacetate-CoA ligase